MNRAALPDVTAGPPKGTGPGSGPGEGCSAGTAGIGSWFAMVDATQPEHTSRSRFKQTLQLSGIALFEYQPDWARDADGLRGEFRWCGARFGIDGIAGAAGLMKLLPAVIAPDREILLHVLGFDRSRDNARRGEFRVSQAAVSYTHLPVGRFRHSARLEWRRRGQQRTRPRHHIHALHSNRGTVAANRGYHAERGLSRWHRFRRAVSHVPMEPPRATRPGSFRTRCDHLAPPRAITPANLTDDSRIRVMVRLLRATIAALGRSSGPDKPGHDA